jgi:NRPS condensation-like uncharacterized protein
MVQIQGPKRYERRVTPIERVFRRSPYSVVTLVARIQGHVTKGLLTNAVSRVQERHPLLRVRIVEDDNGDPWFTSEGVGDIAVEIVSRESDDHWIQVARETGQLPFEFDTRPAMRFVLVQSVETSELVILCHHIICDGLSLAYLARDLMEHLGDPTREVEVLPDPIPIERNTMPEDVSLNAVARFLIKRMNRQWEREKITFDQEDYRNLSAAYWMHYDHQLVSVELSKAQTSALVARCRREDVTVNSALTAAFVGAQAIVLGEKRYHPSIAVAASLRDRLRTPVGEVIGFYAGLATLPYKYNSRHGFWDNARRFHHKIQPLYTNKTLFRDPIGWTYLEPAILESIHFKRIGKLVPERFSRHEKLSSFSTRRDVVLRILQREKMASLDRVAMGTAVTNLTRLDFLTRYGPLELDRLIFKPGGASPLVNANLVVGAVTCAGRLNLVVEFVEENIDLGTMEEIVDRASEWLLDE